MLKHLHLLFVAIVIVSFVVRLAAAEWKPELNQQKWLKIAPHVLATLLLLSGIGLVFQGSWLSANFGWIIAKIVVMCVFIGLGILAMRSQGQQRWLAAAGAFASFFYIVKVAVSKTIFPFF